jgi:aminoglycoside phosphotransferase (APT) family kinase protein
VVDRAAGRAAPPAAAVTGPVDVVETQAQAAALALPPLIVLEPLARWLDARGLGSGPLRATRIGAGHSNATFLLARGDERMVLRRAPRPPLPPSAHDMLREARVIGALAGRVRVPELLAVCPEGDVLGVPFYVMRELHGHVVTDTLPAMLAAPAARRQAGLDLVDALAELHAVDVDAAGLAGLGRPEGYLERQVQRFEALWEHHATRELPLVGTLAGWLRSALPPSPAATVVHGDYRLGNVMLAQAEPRVLALLDWELATLGDPLADLGYLVATYTDGSSEPTALELSPATRCEGFPSRSELVERYRERSGRAVAALAWYEALALWKAAVFCEGLYGRYLRGETADPWTAGLGTGVPGLLRAAALAAERA